MKSLDTIIKDLTSELQKELDNKQVNVIKKTYLTEKIKMLKELIFNKGESGSAK
jgi:hypothetical protein